MIVAPVNPNTVRVGMIKTGCLKTQFNSHYPPRLNGVISEHEFKESITNINSKISSNKSQLVCIVCFILFLVGGLVLTIVGGATASSFRNSRYSYQILLFTGVGLIGFSSIFLTIGCCIVRIHRTSKMRRLIAEESKKYSTVARWRLDVNRMWTVGYGRRVRTVYFYYLIIDILHPVFHPPRPVSTSNLPPPPYPGHPVAYCSQCGVPSSGPTAKFCSSCGHQFNTY